MKWALQLLITLKLLFFYGQWLMYCDGVDSDLHQKSNTSDFNDGSRDQPPPPRDPFPIGSMANPVFGYGDHIPEVAGGGQSMQGITFHPPVLEYGSSPVCIPTVSSFAITSALDIDIELISIIADNPQFYPVLFQPQTLGRADSVMIRILYLPFYTQTASATLTISTSIGNYEYNVIGAPAYNSYRLHPFVGYRIPSGVPFEQPITVYNPHKEVLHIREIFTTEEFISLRGATPSDEGSGGGTWQLEPGVERSIIHLSMGASTPGFYSGYVHLKTDKDNIVIPVDLQVLEGGLHASPDFIDFGVLTRAGETSRVDLKLMNSGSRPVEIVEIVPISPDPQLQVVNNNLNRIVENGTEVVVATFVYNSAHSSGKVSNKLLIVTNHSNPALATLEVPYEVSSVHGGIEYDFTDSLFTLSLQNMSSLANKKLAASLAADPKRKLNAITSDYVESDDVRDVVLTNFYNSPLRIIDVASTTCPDVFFVEPIARNLSVDSLQKFSPIQVQFNRMVAQEMFKHKGTLPKSCWLEVQTNLSTVRFPLLVIDGSLEVSSEREVLENSSLLVRTTTRKKGRPSIPTEEYTIKLGFISSDYPRPIDLIFKNRNPIRVPISLARTNHNITVCWRFAKDFGERAPEDLSSNSHSNFLSPNRSEYLFSMCENYPPYSSMVKYSNMTYELRAEHIVGLQLFIQPLDNGPGSVELRFQTPYQFFHFHLPFVSVPGALINSYKPEAVYMTMGVRSGIDIRTLSTFGDIINIDSVHSSAPLMPAVFHDKMLAEQLDKYNEDAVDQEGFLTAQVITPYLQCLEPFGAVHQLTIWACVYVVLEDWVNTAFSNMSSKNDTEQYEALVNDIRPIEALIMTNNYDSALVQIDSFRTRWMQVCPRGLPLPDVDVMFKASFTHAMLHIQDVHLQVPIASTPMYSAYHIPPVEYGQLMLVSVLLHNPFDVPIKYDLAYDSYLPAAAFEDEHLTSIDPEWTDGIDDVIRATSYQFPMSANHIEAYDNETEVRRLIDVQNIRVQKRLWHVMPNKHPLFSRVQFSNYPPSHIVLYPHQIAEIGTVAFVPSSAAVSRFNMSIVLTNNYTGFHRMDFIFNSGPANLKVNKVSLRRVDRGPELEPIPVPSHAAVSLLVDNGARKASNSKTGVSVAVEQTVSISGVNRSFGVNMSVVNTGVVQSVIYKVLLNGRQSLCDASDSVLPFGYMAMFQSYFTAGQSTVVEMNSCDDLPMRVDPGETKHVLLTVTTDCTLKSDVTRISFVSAVQKLVVMNTFFVFELDRSVIQQCHTVNFVSDDTYQYIGKLLSVLLLVMLGFQLQQQFRLMHQKKSGGKGASDKDNRPTRGSSRSPIKQQYGGNNPRGDIDPNGIITDSGAAGMPKRGSDFSYLRKGIILDDVQAGLHFDERSLYLESVEALKQRRVSSYCSDATERDDDGITARTAAERSTNKSQSESSGADSFPKGSKSKGKKDKGGKRDKTHDKQEKCDLDTIKVVGSSVVESDSVLETTSISYSTNMGSDKPLAATSVDPLLPEANQSTVTHVAGPAAVTADEGVDAESAPKVSSPVVVMQPPSHVVSPSAMSAAVAVPSDDHKEVTSKSDDVVFSTNSGATNFAGANADDATTSAKKSSPVIGFKVHKETEIQHHRPQQLPPQQYQQPTVSSSEPKQGGLVRPPPLLISHNKVGDGMGPGPEREKTMVDLSIDPTEDLVIAPSLSDSGNNMFGKKAPLFTGHYTPRMIHQTSPGVSPSMARTALPQSRDIHHMGSSRLDAPPGLGAPLTPVVMPDPTQRSISSGMETMVAGIVDTDSFDNLPTLGEDPLEGFGRGDIAPGFNALFSTEHDRNRGLSHAVNSPPAPPGFAGALGIYSDPQYKGSLFSLSSFFSESNGDRASSAEESRLPDITTPPSSILRSPAHAQSPGHLSSMFSLPSAVSVPVDGGTTETSDDDLGWAAMLTMPLEDMMHVESLGMGHTPSATAGSTQRAHHYSPSDNARTPSSAGSHMTPSSAGTTGSSLDNFFRSPPMTASDVYGASLGHQYYSQRPQPTGPTRSFQMFDDQISRGSSDLMRGNSYQSQDSICPPGRPTGSTGGGCVARGISGEWPPRDTRVSSNQPMQSQQQYYRPPQQQQYYNRAYQPPGSQQQQQRTYQQLQQPQRHSFGSESYPPLGQDDFAHYPGKNTDWPAEWPPSASGSATEYRSSSSSSVPLNGSNGH